MQSTPCTLVTESSVSGQEEKWPAVDPLELLAHYYDLESPLGRLLLEHSRLVTRRVLELAARLEPQPDLQFIAEAGMFHDIGIFLTQAPAIHCHGPNPYITHGIMGRQLLEQASWPRHALVCERHVGTGLTREEIVQQGLPLPHRDMLCRTREEELISYADKFFSKGQPAALSLAQVRAQLSRYGPGQLGRFEAWQRAFG